MFKPNLNRRLAAALLLSVATAAGALTSVRAQDAGSLASQTESGITRPYEERKLQFNQPGIVTEMKVKVADPVEAAQVIAQQDITVEQAERQALEIEATSKIQEAYARADQGVKEQEYGRKQELFKTKNASVSEVEEARLAVERAKASVELAIQERKMAEAKIASLDARIAQKTLRSPLSGFVQQIETGVGEVGGIDQQKAAFVVVQNDPLKVDVNVPVRTARALKVGQTLQVRYISEDNAEWQPANVTAMLPVADRGSQTRGIQLELPNPQNKPAGLRVEVRLSDVAAAPGQATPAAARLEQ